MMSLNWKTTDNSTCETDEGTEGIQTNDNQPWYGRDEGSSKPDGCSNESPTTNKGRIACGSWSLAISLVLDKCDGQTKDHGSENELKGSDNEGDNWEAHFEDIRGVESFQV